MNKYDFRTLERINKTQAAALYNAGFDVMLIPCKLNPENTFYRLGIWENKFLEGQYSDFNKLVNAFTFYNCNAETGYYPAYYVKRERIMIHFEFVNGSNPYIFRGFPMECKKELAKWGKNYRIEELKQGFYRLEEVA